MAESATQGGRRKAVYAAVNLLYDRETHLVGADISHLPDELLDRLLDRGEATMSKPKPAAE